MTARPRTPAATAHRQRRALARYLRYEVAPYSSFYGPRLRKAGLGIGGLASLDQLRSLPLTTWDEVANGNDLVLRPERQTVLQRGLLRHRWAALAAITLRRPEVANRRVFEPAYKPVRWHRDGGVAFGSSSDDLARLGELGRRLLESAGVVPTDVVASVLDPEGLAFWQLTLGARAAGVSALSLPSTSPVSEVAAYEPTVLVGSIPTLTRLLGDDAPHDADAVDEESGRAAGLGSVRLVVAVGGVLLDDLRSWLSERAGGARVVAAWAPSGVRALWSECVGNRAFHTWPEFEYVEVAEPDGSPARAGEVGEVVWTGIGWRGTALLRFATGAFAVADASPCPSCGHEGVRLWRVAPEPVLFDALDDHDQVADWYATRRARTDGRLRYDVAVALRDGRRKKKVLEELAAVAATEPEFDLHLEVQAAKAVTEHLDGQDGVQVVDGDGPPVVVPPAP